MNEIVRHGDVMGINSDFWMVDIAVGGIMRFIVLEAAMVIKI